MSSEDDRIICNECDNEFTTRGYLKLHHLNAKFCKKYKDVLFVCRKCLFTAKNEKKALLHIEECEEKCDSVSKGQLAYHYCAERRKPFCKETRFNRVSPDRIDVNVTRLSDEISDGDATYKYNVVEKDNYVVGYPMMNDLVSILARPGWQIESVGEFLQTYLEILKKVLS